MAAYLRFLFLVFGLIVQSDVSGQPGHVLKAIEKEESDGGKVIEESDIEMVFVQGGTFEIGGVNIALHFISVHSFYIGKFEITQAQWKKVMNYNESRFKKCEKCPAESLSWNEAEEFVNHLSHLTGKKYRLPTEAEWEYAARGGNQSKHYLYSGSNEISAVGWYRLNSNDETHPVGQKQSNELGIYDMSGNVDEWCSDWCSGTHSTSGSKKVNRGGCCFSDAEELKCISRDKGGLDPDYLAEGIGFRIVRDCQ